MKSFSQYIEEQKVKPLKKGKTKKGEPVMLARGPNGNYHVWIQKANYSAGHNVKKWYRASPEKNMPFKDEQEYLRTGEPDLKKAEALFKRKATGGIVS